MDGLVAHGVLLGIVGLSLVLMLWRPRGWPEVVWVGAGAVLLVALRLVPVRAAGRAVAEGADVYLFLIGMMLLSELARENGVFDWVAAVAVRHARGSAARLFTLMYGVGTLVTVCLSNDATAVVLTPAVLAAVRKAKVQPLPFLFACALIANAASFALPISNPANLVVFHGGAMPPLGRWLLAFGAPSVVSVGLTFAVLRWWFREELSGGVEGSGGGSEDGARLGGDGKLVLAGLGVVVAVLLAESAMGRELGLPTCLAALAVTAVVCMKRRASPWPLAREISWSTLLLVAALFVMVRAVESVGGLAVAVAALGWVARLPVAARALVAGFGVGVNNNLVNNLPLGLIAGSAVGAAGVQGVLRDAVLMGVDLGPNLSVTGSLATILWLLAIRREGLQVSAWDFLKVGAVAMPVALLGALAVRLLF